MSSPIKRHCGSCGDLKTHENSRFIGYAKRDGSELFRSPCRYCEGLGPRRQPGIGKKEWARRARRRAGARPRGEMKPTCVNGHPRTPENLRPGRRDCKVCHRDRQRNAQRAAGAVPYVKRTVCVAGHALVPGNLRRGRHAGDCLLCHRIRETSSYTPDAREYIKMLVNDPCSYCGGPGGTIDHIVPRRDGGSDEWWNLTSACHSCNARKRTSTVLMFVLRQPMGSRAYAAAGATTDAVLT